MGTGISGIGSSSDTSDVTFSEGNGFETLKTEDFVKILITQLSNQNPLQPLEDNQLLQQISSIQALSSTSQLIDTLNAFGLNQNLGAASSLIGREVSAKVGGSQVSGIVNKAVVEDGKVYLLVGDDNVKVPFDSVNSVGEDDSDALAAALAALGAAEAQSSQEGEVPAD